MVRSVTIPEGTGLRPDGFVNGGWWHIADEQPDRVVCDLCPRECHLKPGDRGFCFVRQNLGGEMVLTTYGRSTGFCIDPIEKKPLNHFLPGTSVLSFGTAGCNLGCKFCQNWDISKSREVERLSELATPEMIAAAAVRMGCRSVAYTYNDPVIWAEYAIDCAKACRAVGVKSVAVTAGYISPGAIEPFYQYMDAANVDLKAFTEDFYYKITYSHLQPVLDGLVWLRKESDVWFEITNLVIPQANDSMDEIRQMCDWILDALGDDVPVHFTAFHPDWRMRDRPNTPHQTLLDAWHLAKKQGLKFVYTGNVNDVTHQSTYCPACGELLIERNWYELGRYGLRGDRCGKCQAKIAGVFDERPGDWGRKRVPVRIADFKSAERREPPGAGATVVPSPDGSRRAAIFERPAANSGPPVVALQSTFPGTVSQGTTMSTFIFSDPTANPALSAPPLVADPNPPKLSADQERAIFRAACEIVSASIQNRQPRLPDQAFAGAASLVVMGAFVTLKRRGRLRACCGMLGRPVKLLDAVQQAAVRTALEDVRLPPISVTELPFLDVDVTLLFGFQLMQARGTDRIAAVQVGRHGLQIQRGQNSGLLLPMVPVENDWDAETFLQQLCRKAGLPVTAWKDDATRIQTFEGHAIHGDYDTSTIAGAPAPPWTPEELQSLVQAAAGNLVAMVRGATPSLYLPGCPDGNVHGVTLTMHFAGANESAHLARMSLRPGMPLQSTLFELCKAAAEAVRARGGQNLRLGVTLLTDPAMHGTADEADLRGIDPARRCVVVMENGRTAWAFDPAQSPADLLRTAQEAARCTTPEATAVYSLATVSSEPSLVVSTAPRAVSSGGTRPPGVAGSFYPSDANELNKLVTELLGDVPAEKETWPAIMVPHAGLVYSGRLAADVFKRVTIPDTVIVIGPKHTRLGVEWAVAPHDTWSLPGTTLASDPALAKRLADAIPGLELDAAAHAREHAIEIELPILARLAPRSRVVGIAIGGGNLDRCRKFAAGLAKVLRELPSPPLLVISTDMNHFATDAENRVLDAMALDALDKRDPALVYDTVTKNHISMCGVLPAVIVLETLRELGRLQRSRRIGYATSADVTGDTSRVVGYAGMLFG